MPHIIPTIHPAAILHSGKPLADVIRLDLQKAHRVSCEGYHHPENFVICHPSNPSGLEYTIRQALAWMERWCNLGCQVAIDVETSSLDFFNCDLYSIAVAGNDGLDTAIAWTLMELKTLPWDAELALNNMLRKVLESPRVTTVYHNAPYDYAVLNRKGFKIVGPIEDTLAYAHLIQPDIPRDLGWVGHTFLDVDPWKLDHKGKKKAFTRDVTELLVYNAKDALNTIKLRDVMLREVISVGMDTTLVGWQMAFTRLACNMEVVGMPINWEKRKVMGKTLLIRLELLKTRMREWLHWPDFSPFSKKHAIAALYDRKYVGLTPQAYTSVTKEPSTKYEHLLDHMEHPFVKDFIEFVEGHHRWASQYKGEFKDIGNKNADAGSYLRACQSDGRLHPQVKPCGTKGSRQSTSPNVQNQPLADRAFFEAGPGRVIVGADKDQLELRIAACLAGVNELLIEMAKPDGDPHTLACYYVYGPDFAKRTAEERKRLRDGLKSTVYAAVYRAGVEVVFRTIRKNKKLDHALRASMDLKTVRHIYHSYFGKFVEFAIYHDANYAFVERNGFLSIPPLNRIHTFPVLPAPYTEVANRPIQICGSDIVTMQMVEIQDELNRRFDDAWIILHGHDAVYIECYERNAEAVRDLVNKLFGHYILEGPRGIVDLTASAKIGKSLYDTK